MEKAFVEQVQDNERFEFGKNWKSYLKTLNDEKIQIAVDSIKHMMGVDDLKNKTFLDIGSGSGLFSLAALKLGASVHSVDFDTESINCTTYLREKYYPESDWKITEGSVLDTDYISSLPRYDIVYSWGVLHHTGNMALALENAALPVSENGQLFIAIYNDQAGTSRRWLKVKKIYNSNVLGRMAMTAIFVSYFASKEFFEDVLRFKNPVQGYIDYKNNRGMSKFYDWKDWLGGLPFEVATPEFIFEFYQKRGFHLEKLKTTNGLGCNQFVMKKIGATNY